MGELSSDPGVFMSRIGIALAMSLALLACSRERREEPNPRPGFSDNGAAAAQRIGQYLQTSVVDADLRTCWAQLEGEGVVAADLTYQKQGDNWAFNTAAVKKTSLTGGQEAIAQRCLEEAARATSFTVDSKQELETRAEQFVVRMGWLVPMPPPGTEVSDSAMARTIDPTTGKPTISGCSVCEVRVEYPYGNKCVAHSSGSNVDCQEINSNTCATTPKACLRGAFGGTRGLIMF